MQQKHSDMLDWLCWGSSMFHRSCRVLYASECLLSACNSWLCLRHLSWCSLAQRPSEQLGEPQQHAPHILSDQTLKTDSWSASSLNWHLCNIKISQDCSTQAKGCFKFRRTMLLSQKQIIIHVLMLHQTIMYLSCNPFIEPQAQEGNQN